MARNRQCTNSQTGPLLGGTPNFVGITDSFSLLSERDKRCVRTIRRLSIPLLITAGTWSDTERPLRRARILLTRLSRHETWVRQYMKVALPHHVPRTVNLCLI